MWQKDSLGVLNVKGLVHAQMYCIKSGFKRNPGPGLQDYFTDSLLIFSVTCISVRNSAHGRALGSFLLNLCLERLPLLLRVGEKIVSDSDQDWGKKDFGLLKRCCQIKEQLHEKGMISKFSNTQNSLKSEFWLFGGFGFLVVLAFWDGFWVFFPVFVFGGFFLLFSFSYGRKT